MDKGRFLIETHLRTGRPDRRARRRPRRAPQLALQAPRPLPGRRRRRPRGPLSTARTRARPASPALRGGRSSRCARSSPTSASTPAPLTIQSHLARRHDDVPSVIDDLAGPQGPRASSPPSPTSDPRAPTSASKPTCPTSAGRPTSPTSSAADGSVLEVLNIIDDHSRLCVASRAFLTTRSPDVVRTMHRAAADPGLPSQLPDRQRRHLHRQLPRRHGRHGDRAAVPGHRLQALPALPPPDLRQGRALPPDPQEVPRQARPRRSPRSSCSANSTPSPPTTTTSDPTAAIGRRTPAEAFAAREKAFPTGPRIDCPGYRVRHDRVDKSGNVTLRYRGRLHHIGVGAAYKGWRVILLVAGHEIRILT